MTLSVSEQQFLTLLKQLGVPMKESVPFLCRLKGIPMNSITRAAGYNRNGLSQALKDGRKPMAPLYQSVIDHLHVDPWAVYEEDAGGIDPESSENHSL